MASLHRELAAEPPRTSGDLALRRRSRLERDRGRDRVGSKPRADRLGPRRSRFAGGLRRRRTRRRRPTPDRALAGSAGGTRRQRSSGLRRHGLCRRGASGVHPHRPLQRRLGLGVGRVAGGSGRALRGLRGGCRLGARACSRRARRRAPTVLEPRSCLRDSFCGGSRSAGRPPRAAAPETRTRDDGVVVRRPRKP